MRDLKVVLFLLVNSVGDIGELASVETGVFKTLTLVDELILKRTPVVRTSSAFTKAVIVTVLWLRTEKYIPVRTR